LKVAVADFVTDVSRESVPCGRISKKRTLSRRILFEGVARHTGRCQYMIGLEL